MKILSKQNFNQNESKNFVVDNLSSAPSNPILGQVYYNTQNERAYVCIKSGETPEWADLSLQEEVSIGREEPNGRDIKIWINPEDMASSSDYGSLPIGSIIPYSGETAPEGYSICDGKELNRETYKELFSIIGTTFGNGDGTSTFNLPDLKGRISVGLDSSDTDFDTLGKTGGKKTHTLTIDEIPAHTHNLTYNASGAGANTGGTVALGNTSTTTLFATLPTGGSKEHNNLQPYIVLNYIIKIYGEAMLTGDVIDSLEGDSSYNAPSIHAVNTKIKELEAYSSTAINEGLGNIKGQISWTNPNPTSGMGNDTTITLSNDDYDFIEVIFLTYPSRKTYSSNKVFNVDGAGEINALFNYSGILFGGSRYFTFVDKTHLKFETCYGMNIKDNNDYKARNDWLIPYKIITYKTGLFDNTATQTASEEPSSDESIVSDEIISEEPTI